MIDSIEFRENGVLAVLCGTITSKELFEVNNQFLDHLKKNPYKYQILVIKDVEDVIVSATELQYTAIRDVEAFKNSPVEKVAIVTDSPLIFGLARMYEAYAGESKAVTRIFKTLHEAEEWIR